MLKCITKGNTSAYGKQKVYFTSHPSDIEEYRDVLSRFIFRSFNVAYYYDDGIGERYDFESEADLYSLVVIPVTKTFLTTKNVSKDADLAVVLKHGIPFIPFTFDQNDSILFNRVVGKYQCMYAGQQTGDEKNFYTKLDSFLEEVLQPDDIKQEILDKAFDLKLFISYRKKNRSYVNEFIKLLHKRWYLFTVGFWYDELLSSGESYDYEIDQALKDSDIFLLIVTPDLLEEGNYVQTVEYANAISYQKKIVAFELSPVNRTKFYQAFPYVSHYFTRDDISEIIRFFSTEIFAKVGRKERSRYQQYLLGQAYLYGIGTENDYQAGYSFMRQIAKDGYIPAIEEMILIGNSLFGRKFTTEEMLFWYHEAQEGRKYLFEQEPNKGRLLGYLHAIGEYGHALAMYGQKKEAVERLEYYIKICEMNQIGCEDMLKVYYDLGRLYLGLGETNKAEEAFAMQIQMCDQYYHAKGELDVSCSRSFYSAHILLGDMALERNELDKAFDYYRTADRIADMNYQRFPQNDTLNDQASSSARIGKYFYICAQHYPRNSAECNDCLFKARYFLMEAAHYKESAYKEMKSIENHANLIEYFYDVGEVSYFMNDFQTAKNYLIKAGRLIAVLKDEVLETMEMKEFISMFVPKMPKVYTYLYRTLQQLGEDNTRDAMICLETLKLCE